jgi:hypothetical protein
MVVFNLRYRYTACSSDCLKYVNLPALGRLLVEERVMRKLLTLLIASLGVLLIVSGSMAASYTVGVGGDSATVRFKYDSPTIYLWGFETTPGNFQLVSSGSSADQIFTITTDITFVLKDKSTNTILDLGDPKVSTYKFGDQSLIWSLEFTAPNGKSVFANIPSPDSSGGDYFAAASVQTPEPASLFLLAGTMVVGLGFLRRNQKKS